MMIICGMMRSGESGPYMRLIPPVTNTMGRTRKTNTISAPMNSSLPRPVYSSGSPLTWTQDQMCLRTFVLAQNR